MRILLDHCVPKPFARLLQPHEVGRDYSMGWSRLSNGKLLEAAASSGLIDVVITVDQNVLFQQHLPQVPISVVVLISVKNTVTHLQPHVPHLLALLPTLPPRSVASIDAVGTIAPIQ